MEASSQVEGENYDSESKLRPELAFPLEVFDAFVYFELE
tara:strand:+ start:1166 stop:1282 length:117 start_codon:yes stop_codon:yes gene_type:complete